MGRNGLMAITLHDGLHAVYEDVQRQGFEDLVRGIEDGIFQQSNFNPCLGEGPVKIPTSSAFTQDGQRALIGSLAVFNLLSFAMPTSH